MRISTLIFLLTGTWILLALYAMLLNQELFILFASIHIVSTIFISFALIHAFVKGFQFEAAIKELASGNIANEITSNLSEETKEGGFVETIRGQIERLSNHIHKEATFAKDVDSNISALVGSLVSDTASMETVVIDLTQAVEELARAAAIKTCKGNESLHRLNYIIELTKIDADSFEKLKRNIRLIQKEAEAMKKCIPQIENTEALQSYKHALLAITYLESSLNSIKKDALFIKQNSENYAATIDRSRSATSGILALKAVNKKRINLLLK